MFDTWEINAYYHAVLYARPGMLSMRQLHPVPTKGNFHTVSVIFLLLIHVLKLYKVKLANCCPPMHCKKLSFFHAA